MKANFRILVATLGMAVVAQAQTTITVASFPDLDRAVKAALPQWQKLHPDIEVKLVSLAFPDHHNAMTTALATGTGLPDVMAVEIGFVGKFAESGGLEDLSKAPYNAGQFRSKWAKFAYPQGLSVVNGALAAVPVDIGAGTLFYRKDMLDKAGVTEADLTKSWESYVNAGKKIKQATGAYMLANAVDLKDIMIRSNIKPGEGVYFDSKGKVLVESPRFIKAFEVAKAARSAGIDAKINAWSSEWSEAFKRDQIATQMMGSWLSGHLKNWLAPASAGKWRASQLPANAFASWGGSFYAIPSKAANKEAAWQFIQYLSTDKQQQLTAFRELDAFPALVEAMDDPFAEQPIEYLGGQKARLLWRDAAHRIPETTVDKYDPAANEVINAELDKVLEQGKDIKAALTDAKKQIERRARR